MKNNITKLHYKFIILSIVICSICFFIGTITNSDVNNSIAKYETRVHFINVGQGDCILIENNNFNILIDSGPNSSTDKVINYLKKLKIHTLDYVISTHPHEDHIGAMDDIIKVFKINKFIMPKATSNDSDFPNMIKALRKKNLTIDILEDDTTIKLCDNNYISFLWTGNIIDDNLNNYSMVLKYANKNTSFLFTGDSEETVEYRLLSSNSPINSDVLKVGHHGSKSSSSLPFINKVSPVISIISCGIGNDYGHPHENTLDSLNEINSKVFRTDINGNITLKTDGDKLMVHTEYRAEN